MKKSIKKSFVVLNNKQMNQVKGGMKRFEELKDLLTAKGQSYTDAELINLYEQYLAKMEMSMG